MRTVGSLAASVLDMISEEVRAGVSTDDLNDICHNFIVNDLEAIPAPLNYRGFPKSICTSVNHVVCHGIPGDRVLKDGDVLNIDITVIKDGYHGDTVHESFFKLVDEFGNKSGQHGAYTQGEFEKIIEHRTTGRTVGFENGHGIWESPMTEEAILAMKNGPHAEYVQKLEELRGEKSAHQMLNSMNLMIFPNLAVAHGQLRLIRPIAIDRTEVAIYFYDLESVPESYNEFRMSGYQRFFGPAGFGSPDDVEIFSINQTGLQAEEVEWLLLSRGMQREQMDDKGVRTGDPTDETPQRAFHRAWKKFMTTNPGRSNLDIA